MSYTGKDQTPELTYPLIKRAVYGDEAALEVILRHFDAYINAGRYSREGATPSGGDYRGSGRGHQNPKSRCTSWK